jgi:hypothetical protein
MNAATPPFDASTEDVTQTIDTTGWPDGSYDIYVYGSDTATPAPNNNLTSTVFATIVISTPPVNNAPTLDWTGETYYLTDGLHPETGEPTTSFEFRIVYTDADDDAPASGDPKLHVMLGGTAISGSPFSMTFDSGTYSTGAIYTHSMTLAVGSYSYYFTASDSVGDAAAPTAEKQAPVVSAPETPPDAPVGITVVTPSERGSLVVSWDANTEPDIDGYNVYRSSISYAGTGGSGYELVASLDSTQLSFTDTNLDDGDTYYYVVKAVDADGNESDYSEEVSGTTMKAPSEEGLDLTWLLWILIVVIVILIFIIILTALRRNKDDQGGVQPQAHEPPAQPEEVRPPESAEPPVQKQEEPPKPPEGLE